MLGYDAGRLLDQIVGILGDDLRPGTRLRVAVHDAAAALVATIPDVADPRDAEAKGGNDDELRTALLLVAPVLFVGAVVLTARSRTRPR